MAQEIRVDRNCFSLFGKEPHLWRLYCDEKSKRLRGTDEGNGSLCLPATISVVAFWLSAGFATARMLQGCYMVQRQGVCGSRFDSDDVQTCGIIVLLLCAQVQLNVCRFWWWWCRFVLIFYSCLSSSSACSSWSLSSLIDNPMRDASLIWVMMMLMEW
jgi:hypothetical protein